MTLIEIARKDSRSVHTYCTRTAVVLAVTPVIIGSWSVSTYRMFMYESGNHCEDGMNTEGCRDPASRLTQTVDKRRKRAMLAETDEQKHAGKVEKAEERDGTRHSDCQWKR